MAKLLTDAVVGAITPRNIAAYWREPIRFLEFLNTVTVSAPDPYTQWKIANLSYTVVAGDVLRYDVWADPMNPGLGAGGIDLVFTGAPFTAAAAGVVDQNALALWGPLNLVNTGVWYTRTCSLTPIVGKALTSAQLVNGGDAVGAHRARYRNIRITDAAGSTVRANIWLSGDPAFNVDAGSQSNAGQNAVAYDSDGWLGDPAHASFALGTRAELRDGVDHSEGLAVFPAPSDQYVSDQGIQVGGGFSVQYCVGINRTPANPHGTVREMAPALELVANYTTGANPYTYRRILAPAYTIASGDVLRVDTWVDPKNPGAGGGSVEIEFTTGSPANGRSVPIVDQNGVVCVTQNSASRGVWLTRAFSLTAAAGKVINSVDLVNEVDALVFGAYRSLFRNIRITDAPGTTVKLDIWSAGAPTLNLPSFPSVGASDEGIRVIEAPLTTDTTFNSALDLLASPKNIIGRTFELELVSQVGAIGAAAREIRDVRRAKCTQAALRGGLLEATFASVTNAALEAIHPSATYTVADFAELFEGHVGKPIPDGVGQLVRVPMAWIKKTGGTWRHAICEKRAGMTYTVQTIYRGESEGEVGRVVPAAEYTVGSTVGSSTSIEVLDVIFTREQLNGSGQPYALSADVLINSGSGATEARVASNEIKRLLVKAGLTTDATTFDAAATYGVTHKMFVDGGYVRPRTLKAILQDLLFLARGMLGKTDSGRFTLIQDKAGSSVASFMETADLIQCGDVEYTDSPAKVSMYYKPSVTGSEDWLATPLIRTPGGALPERRYQNPYIRDHETADRLLDYLAKRDSVGVTASATIHAVQLDPRELITIEHGKELRGSKTWQVTEVQRPADRNELALALYDAAIHTYTAGTLPSAASNTYTPDYSNTPPLAPTSPSVVTNTTAVDASGKAFAALKVRVVPPSVNWAKLFVRAQNTSDNSITAAVPMTLVSGNYEAIIGTLLPSQAYTLIFYAQNANGLDGATVTLSATAATYAGAPPTPSGLGIAQDIGNTVVATIPTPTYAHHARVEWQVKLGAGGSYTTIPDVNSPRLVYNPGSYATWYFKCRFIDASGNAGAYCSENFVTTVAAVNDTHIVALGVNAASLGNNQVAQGKIKYTVFSGSLSMLNGDILDLCSNGPSCFVPYLEGLEVHLHAHYGALPSAGQISAVNKYGSTQTVPYSWYRLDT